MRLAIPCSFLILAACASAQPLLYYRGVSNAASNMPQVLPGGGIAQGSIFIVSGAGLGPKAGALQNTFPLSTTLQGVTVTVTQGSRSVSAVPLYADSSQIYAIMPSNAPLGMASIQVTISGSTSNPLPVNIVGTSLGIFSMDGSGMGPGAVQNLSRSAGSINSPRQAAALGDTVVLAATGLGPINGADNVAPTVGDLSTPVEVFVGGQSASVFYHGRASCCAGEDEIEFTVPSNAPLGCWVPVYVQTGGVTVSNVVTMAIQKNGGVCSDPANPFSSVIVSGGKAGAFVAVRATTHEDIGTTTPVDVETDFQASTFYSQTASPYPFNSGISLPPPGTCTVLSLAGDLLNGDMTPFLTPNGAALTAGAITLTGPNGSQAMSLPSFVGFPQFTLGYFGGTIAGTDISGTLALNPGTYKVSSTAGSQVGAFSATLNVPAPVTWTDRDSLVTVNRSQPLTISWTGGSSKDRVGIAGFGEDLPGNATTMFVCVAQPGASSFTIPSQILANLPATRANPLQSSDVIYLVSVPGSAEAAITPSGLNAGEAMFTYIDGKTVIYQ
jgi:uncharacterized protein (TIGR03437 family)